MLKVDRLYWYSTYSTYFPLPGIICSYIWKFKKVKTIALFLVIILKWQSNLPLTTQAPLIHRRWIPTTHMNDNQPLDNKPHTYNLYFCTDNNKAACYTCYVTNHRLINFAFVASYHFSFTVLIFCHCWGPDFLFLKYCR